MLGQPPGGVGRRLCTSATKSEPCHDRPPLFASFAQCAACMLADADGHQARCCIWGGLGHVWAAGVLMRSKGQGTMRLASSRSGCLCQVYVYVLLAPLAQRMCAAAQEGIRITPYLTDVRALVL